MPWPPGPQLYGRSAGVRLQRLHRAGAPAARPRAPDHGRHPRLVPADEGIDSMALNASRDGQPLYESMGYPVPPSPMMFRAPHGVVRMIVAVYGWRHQGLWPLPALVTGLRLVCGIIRGSRKASLSGSKRPDIRTSYGDSRACRSSSPTPVLKPRTPPAWTSAQWTVSIPRKDEAEFAEATMLYIHPEECIDCGACVPACPVAAIYESIDATPSHQKDLIEANAVYRTAIRR